MKKILIPLSVFFVFIMLAGCQKPSPTAPNVQGTVAAVLTHAQETATAAAALYTPTATCTVTDTPNATLTAQAIYTMVANANATATMTAMFVTQWDINQPSGIAIDYNGYLYVLDSGNRLIQKLTQYGSLMTQWGGYGTGNGQFESPSGISADGYGYIYVSDSQANRIQKFDSSGNYLSQWGAYGTGAGQFNSPTGITEDISGNIYVADTGNERIQAFYNTEAFMAQWPDSVYFFSGLFTGLALDQNSGNVYFLDYNTDIIHERSGSGSLITQWGSQGIKNGQFESPRGVAADYKGNVYVADTGNNRVQKFDSSGNFITQWGSSTGNPGSGVGQFSLPMGIVVDRSGYVYVADTGNNRVEVFLP